MTAWKKSKWDSLSEDEESRGSDMDCEVVINGSRIVISYEQAGYGKKVWEGTEIEPGHFELKLLRLSGDATLHRSRPDIDILEGSWREMKEDGMWKIRLRD